MRVRPGVWELVDHYGRGLRAVNEAREFVVHARHIATVEEQHRAIGIGVLHRIDVEILVLPNRRDSDGPPMAIASTGHAPFIHGKLVDLVNIVIAEYTAAGPQERMKPADLVHQFAGALGA